MYNDSETLIFADGIKEDYQTNIMFGKKEIHLEDGTRIVYDAKQEPGIVIYDEITGSYYLEGWTGNVKIYGTKGDNKYVIANSDGISIELSRCTCPSINDGDTNFPSALTSICPL